jgi:hypothetical protein
VPRTARPLGEPGQPVPGARAGRSIAVVLDLDGRPLAIGVDADVAVTGVAVPNDVGGPFAHGPREHGVDLGWHRQPVFFDVVVDARRGQGRAGTLERFRECEAAIALYRLADLGQRLPVTVSTRLSWLLFDERATSSELVLIATVTRCKRANNSVQAARSAGEIAVVSVVGLAPEAEPLAVEGPAFLPPPQPAASNAASSNSTVEIGLRIGFGRRL